MKDPVKDPASLSLVEAGEARLWRQISKRQFLYLIFDLWFG